jgi:hypothetical protein
VKIENSTPPIILLHPGKTGGTSIEHTLKDLYLPKGYILDSKSENFDIMFGFSKKYKCYLQHADLRLFDLLNINVKNYTTISCVRNPYTKIISNYFYTGQDKTLKFNDFIKKKLEKFMQVNIDRGYAVNHFCPQIYYTTHGDFKTDYIIKLENYKSDCKKAKIDVKYHFSKTIATKKLPDPLSLYTTQSKDIVYNIYKNDFLEYGYEK